MTAAEKAIQLEEAYARATVALTQARRLCVLLCPLDQKGPVGAATIEGFEPVFRRGRVLKIARLLGGFSILRHIQYINPQTTDFHYRSLLRLFLDLFIVGDFCADSTFLQLTMKKSLFGGYFGELFPINLN